MSALLGNISKFLAVGFTYKEETTFKKEKKKHKILVQWLSATLGLLFHACLRCRTLVDTNVLLLYELFCSVQGRLKAVLLCLGHVDTVAFEAWFVPAWCAQKKGRFENQNFVVVCDPPAYGNQSLSYS